MRTWFWTILVVALAVGLALVLREHSGNVLIIAQPWRIELSLTFAVLLLIALFIALYVIIRVVAWLISRPEKYRTWRGQRAQKKDHELLQNGWISVLEGRFTQAESELRKLVGRTSSVNTKVLASLALARAYHQSGEFNQRDELLQTAKDAANVPRLKEATLTVAAEMYLEQDRATDALTLLQPFEDGSARYSNATRLLLRAHHQLNNYEQVYTLTRLLVRRKVFNQAQATPLIEASTTARLQANGIEGFKAIWGDLKSSEKTLPGIALAAASVQDAAGNFEEAGKILEAALNVSLDARLLAAYSTCPPEQVARRLGRAEVWLKSHPDNPDLLAALGNLCLIGQLWGPGERYLLRSKKVRSDVRVHALLGNLYDRLGRQEDAVRHWRLASRGVVILPTLELSTLLPAADTTYDPALIDVESVDDRITHADFNAPVAASAADYSHDEMPEGVAPPPAADVPSVADSENEFDEYFDSAPIPGVDLSNTSDRSRNDPDRR